MPHIIVEHTQSVEKKIKMLNENLHTCLSEQETVSLASIKTRSIKVSNAIVGDGLSENFVHISVLLLAGRSDELKNTMAENLFNCAKSILDDSDLILSVNIDELGAYKK